MDGDAVSGLYPLHRCKNVHLIRHGQAVHNVAGEKERKAYLDPQFFDAHLTPFGWNQVDKLRKHISDCGLANKIELVITSPLTRTMQTAIGVFGSESETGGPPFIAIEDCRERVGKNPCDKRRSITEYRSLFPAIDFSQVESDEDVNWHWKADSRETNEELAARGVMFFNWLWTRKEREIVVVSHTAFLLQTLLMFGNDTHPFIKHEISEPFSNCEMRSMVLVDTRMLGRPDISTTNYLPKVLHRPTTSTSDSTNSDPDNLSVNKGEDASLCNQALMK